MGRKKPKRVSTIKPTAAEVSTTIPMDHYAKGFFIYPRIVSGTPTYKVEYTLDPDIRNDGVTNWTELDSGITTDGPITFGTAVTAIRLTMTGAATGTIETDIVQPKGKGKGRTKGKGTTPKKSSGGGGVPADRDANFADATLYLPFTTDLQDHSNVGATMTVNGSPALSATTPKFGSNSAYSPGSLAHQADNIVSPVNAGNYNTGTGDFTIMGWWRFDSTRAASTDPFPILCGSGGFYASAGTWSLQYYKATGAISFFNDGSNNPNVSGFTQDTWHHIAVIRSAGSMKVYLDGVGGTPQAKATNIGYLDDKIEIFSGLSGATDNGDWGGNCQDFVFMPGVAWKTSNFTPPTIPFGGTGS